MGGAGRLRLAGSAGGGGGGTWGGLGPGRFHCSLDAVIKAESHTQGPWPHPRVGEEGPGAPWGQTHMPDPSPQCPALRPQQAGRTYLGLDLAPLLFRELAATPLLQLLQDAAVDGQAAVHLAEERVDVSVVGAEQALADLCELSAAPAVSRAGQRPGSPLPPPAARALASPEGLGGGFRRGHLLASLAWWQGAHW